MDERGKPSRKDLALQVVRTGRPLFAVGFDFGEMDLSSAGWLRGANLTASMFYASTLQASDLSYAELQGCEFCEADLMSTSFMCANIGDANFRRASVHGADFRCAIGIESADWREVDGLDSAIFDARGREEVAKSLARYATTTTTAPTGAKE